MLLVALSLVMLLTGVVPVQARPVEQQSPAERLDLVPEGCEIDEHKPGEFVVRYESEEAMKKAPQENVAETYVWGPPSHRLVFEEIKKETDPKERRDMEEAKKEQLEKQPGVAEDLGGERGVNYVWGPDHSPGEFWVRYESKEAMEKAPKTNVVEERGGEGPGGFFMQRLRFEDIENQTDPKERRVMEEDEMQRLQKRPGVELVGYAYPDVHLPGEFSVIYESEEAMKAVPREYVVEESVEAAGPDPPFIGWQRLVFEEIKKETDPNERRDMEEAKIRELKQKPGVRDATYLPGDADPDCYWDTYITPGGNLNFTNARYELYEYVCSSDGLKEGLFGGDADAQRGLCGIYGSDPQACAFTHKPGEFVVNYPSKEAMRAAPKENVVREKVESEGSVFAQLLVFEEIRDEPDPNRQRTMRIAKLQEIEARPGVQGVRYVNVAPEQSRKCIDAEFGNSRSGDPDEVGTSGPAGLYYYVCESPEGLGEVFGGDVDFHFWFCIPPGGGGGGGWCYPNCNRGVVDRARELIGGKRPSADNKANGRSNGKAGGKAAFDLAYDAARSGSNGAGKAALTPGSNPGGSETNERGASAPSKPERTKAGKKEADAGSDANKETGEAADDPEEADAPYVGGSGSGAGATEPGGGGEAVGAGLRDTGEGAGEAVESSPGGDTADEREGHDGETGSHLTDFLSDAFYSVSDGNPGSANGRVGGMDATVKETAAGETAAGEAVADEAGDGPLSFLRDPFRGNRGGVEGGDDRLGEAENAAASRDLGMSPSAVALSVGALLAAGVLVVRRFLRR